MDAQPRFEALKEQELTTLVQAIQTAQGQGGGSYDIGRDPG